MEGHECGVNALSLVQLAAVIGERGWSLDVATCDL